MKRINAILFSLLLIATHCVALAVSAGSMSAAPGCCCTGCNCAVSNEAGASPFSEATVAPGAYSHFVFLPVARVVYETARAMDSAFFSPADASKSASSQPLYRLKCALLI